MKPVPPHIKHKYPGSWLFSKRILSWLFIPQVRAQLPLLIRLFSHYAQNYFQITNYDYLRGGRKIFLVITWINKVIFNLEYRTLKLPEFLICIDLTDPRFLNVINELMKTQSETILLTNLLQKGDTFIDIGANHGSFSIIASKIVGENGHIIAIEPQPRLSYCIEQSLQFNSPCSFEVLKTAVGNYTGEITFMIPVDTSGTAGIFPSHSAKYHHRKIRVPIRTFDNLVDWHTCTGKTIIKVDIEGGEYGFLQGSSEFLSKLDPILIMEINPQSLKCSETKKKDLIDLLITLGYKWFAETHSPNEKSELTELQIEHFRNVIFYKT